MRAALYLRISLDKTGKRAGVERQRTDCEALCGRRDWAVAAVYEDNSVSAYNGTTRPGYERLVAAVAAGEVDVVVAWHTDRLWRNVVEQQAFLAIGRDAGLKLVATPSNEVDPADADDDFLSTVLAAAAQKESADKSRRMRRRQAEKAEKGEWHGGRRSYGYRAVGGSLKIVEKEAAVIRGAAARVLAGESLSGITNGLIRSGVTTTTGCRWRVDTLAALLRSPRIAGLRVHNGGPPVPATWPAIIDVADHERLVALADARSLGPRHQPPRRHLLTGLLRCGRCGATLAPGVKGATPRYVCKTSANGGCSGVSVVMEHAHGRVLDLVVAYLDSPEFAAALERARRAADGVDRALVDAVDALARDRTALGRLDDAFADGLLDRDRYRRQVTRLRARIDAGERLVASTATTAPTTSYDGQGELVRAAWERMHLDEQRQIVEAVTLGFVVAPAGRPFNVWRPERVSPEWRFA